MKQKLQYFMMGLTLVLLLISIFFVVLTPRKESKVNPLQYYGQVINIKMENNQKIIRVKGGSTPYAQYDNNLEGEVELIVPEGISLKMRVGSSNEIPKLSFGDLSKMYDELEDGDYITFLFKDLVFESRKEISEIIFTGN